jgi:ketopantoate reductase
VDLDLVSRRLARLATFRHTPSMLQDLRKPRGVEIAAQLLCIPELGKRRGVPTPLFDTLLPLVECRASVQA